jgi:hypothetical protein
MPDPLDTQENDPGVRIGDPTGENWLDALLAEFEADWNAWNEADGSDFELGTGTGTEAGAGAAPPPK